VTDTAVVADAIFEVRRLAEIYDPIDSDRSDLDAYLALTDELGATSVVDIGCGTGTFACLLAHSGREVVAVDPAVASLDVARAKPGAELVTWIVGTAAAVPSMQADLVTMTANVAQVFVTDDDWTATLGAARRLLRAGGALAFEVRDPAREAWKDWDRERSYRRVELAEAGAVETWVEVTEVELPLVSFRWTFRFEADGAELTSDSTLRFRSRSEIEASLVDAGFEVAGVRDAPDRPGRELVFIATAI
jgi:ubiquinone/menaquinone biosynthesis C-methylase UbiE